MSDDEDSGEDVDVSVVRKAIKISGNMVEQILKGIHYGSPEVRCLLYSECDYILECKVCRNLFRSLPNFVAHKRSYCKTAYQESETFFGELRADEETVIVQPEAPEDSAVNSKRSKPRTLESTIQLLKDGFLGKSDAYKMYTKAAEKMEAQKEQRKTQTLTFEPIPNTTQAMKVTVADGEPMEVEEEEPSTTENKSTGLQSSPTATLKSMLLKSALEGDTTSTSPNKSNGNPTNSRIVSPTTTEAVISDSAIRSTKQQGNPSPPKKMTLRCKEGINSMPWKKARKDDNEPNSPEKGMDFKNLLCMDCNTSFRSRKTLIFHYQNAHCGKRTFYPCPYCNGVFFYIFGLTRHLMRNHNKSKAQVDKMRSKLKKSAFVKQVTEPCQSARQQILHVRDIEPEHEAVDANSEPQNTKIKTSVKREAGDIIQNESSLNSPTKEREHVCSNCHRAFGKKLSLLNHRRICLTQDCVMSHPLDNCKAKAYKSNPQDKESRSSVDGEKSSSEDVTKRPTVKMTKLTGRARFSARSTSQRVDYAKMANPVLPNIDDSNIVSMKSSPGDLKGNTAEKSKDRTQRLIQRQRYKNEITSTEPHKEEIKKEVGTDMMSDQDEELDGRHKVRVVEEIWVDKQPGRPTEKVKSNRTYVMKSSASQKLECQDTKKVTAIVNESDLQCRHCDQEFSNVSNLRRHAIRHLGWKRYKCKMCKFSSYNKSECNTHLYRTHSDRFRNVSSVNSLIVDLGKEGSRARLRKKQQTLSEKQALEEEDNTCSSQRQNHRRTAEVEKDTTTKKSSADEKLSETVSTRFNISTRNCPREFDTSPYKNTRRNENMTSLCTRKSSYPKKLIIPSQGAYHSDDEDSVSNASGYSSLGKTDSIFLSYLSEISAKAKAEEAKSVTSDTESETSKGNKTKNYKVMNLSGDSLGTRRSGRGSDSVKSSPSKSGVSSTTSSKSGDDAGELKACKNLSNKLTD